MRLDRCDRKGATGSRSLLLYPCALAFAHPTGGKALRIEFAAPF